MRVLAVGGTGFIGAWVTRLLSEQGHDVAVLHRGSTIPELPVDVYHIHGDRNELAEVQPHLYRFRPDVVLDVIPYTESQARKLVETLRGRTGRIVVVSSADVYRNYDGFRGRATAPPDPVPLSEEAPLRETRYPYRGYGFPFDWADEYEKILVERLVVSEPDIAGTVLRLPAVYGPGDKQHRIGPYFARMNADRPGLLLAKDRSEWRWTRGYVENVAAAIALAISDDRAAGRVYNVGEERALTEREWIEAIGSVSGWKGQIIEVPTEHLPEHLRQPFDFSYHLATDTSRIRAELSYREPVSRSDALKRTIQWERTNPSKLERPDYAAEDALIKARPNAV